MFAVIAGAISLQIVVGTREREWTGELPLFIHGVVFERAVGVRCAFDLNVHGLRAAGLRQRRTGAHAETGYNSNTQQQATGTHLEHPRFKM